MAEMSTLIYIITLIAGISLILIARNRILRLTDKLSEVLEELRKGN